MKKNSFMDSMKFINMDKLTRIRITLLFICALGIFTDVSYSVDKRFGICATLLDIVFVIMLLTNIIGLKKQK